VKYTHIPEYERAEEAAQRGDKDAYAGIMEPVMKRRGRFNPDAPKTIPAKHLIFDALMFTAGAASLAFVALMIAVAVGVV